VGAGGLGGVNGAAGPQRIVHRVRQPQHRAQAPGRVRTPHGVVCGWHADRPVRHPGIPHPPHPAPRPLPELQISSPLLLQIRGQPHATFPRPACLSLTARFVFAYQPRDPVAVPRGPGFGSGQANGSGTQGARAGGRGAGPAAPPRRGATPPPAARRGPPPPGFCLRRGGGFQPSPGCLPGRKRLPGDPPFLGGIGVQGGEGVEKRTHVRVFFFPSKKTTSLCVHLLPIKHVSHQLKLLADPPLLHPIPFSLNKSLATTRRGNSTALLAPGPPKEGAQLADRKQV